MSKNQLAQTLLEMAGQKNVITVHRAFVNFTGSLEAGMLLSQLLYWTPRARDGWIAKSDNEFTEELCLSRYALRRAREDLVATDILETKLKRFNSAPVTHYHLKMNKLQEEWIVWINKIGLSGIVQSDCLESDNGLSGIEQSLTETTTEITIENLASAKNADARADYSVENKYRKQTEQSLLKGLAKAKENGDLADYPEDVRPTIQAVAEYFKLRPPTTKKGKGYWIMQARELIDACGEWGTRAIQEYRQDFEVYMEGHQGLAPHTVEGPGSLVKVVRAKSGLMRGDSNKDTSEMSDREYRQYLEKHVWRNND